MIEVRFDGITCIHCALSQVSRPAALIKVALMKCSLSCTEPQVQAQIAHCSWGHHMLWCCCTAGQNMQSYVTKASRPTAYQISPGNLADCTQQLSNDDLQVLLNVCDGYLPTGCITTGLCPTLYKAVCAYTNPQTPLLCTRNPMTVNSSQILQESVSGLSHCCLVMQRQQATNMWQINCWFHWY